MKKIILLSIPILVAVFLVVPLAVLELGQTPGWEAELNQYLDARRGEGALVYTVETAQRAKAPWNFTQKVGFRVWGDSVYYQTDVTYTGEAGSGALPLPYPPEEVWCIVLANRTGKQLSLEERRLVFAARHQDLYNADWVIHEAEDGALRDGYSAETLRQLAANLGCGLEPAALTP